MKTNHRDGTKKRQDHRPGYYGPVAAVKEEGHFKSRAEDRRISEQLLNGRLDADEMILPSRAVHTSNGWHFD